MNISVTVRKNGFKGASKDVATAITKGLDTAKGPLLGDMQRRTPVDTGELRASESAEVSGKTLTLKATAEHAIYVHQGARGQMARPFMRDAIEQGMPTVEDAIATAIEGALR